MCGSYKCVFTGVHVFRSEIQKKELDLARVKDANYDLTEERLQLTTKLTDTDKKARERKEEIQKLKMQYVTELA